MFFAGSSPRIEQDEMKPVDEKQKLRNLTQKARRLKNGSYRVMKDVVGVKQGGKPSVIVCAQRRFLPWHYWRVVE